MRVIQGIGVLNVLLGLFALIAPIKFYRFATGLFTPEVSPPFGMGAIHEVTFLLFIPGMVLLTNGIALILLGQKLERVPELKAYTETGEYLGRVKGVEMEHGEVEEFEIVDDKTSVELEKEDVSAMDHVVLVKDEAAREAIPFGSRHEFVGMEVYTLLGAYWGKVESVILGPDGGVDELVAVKGTDRRIIKMKDVDSTDEIILVREP
jgi:sporulation protein YlmC with PRC-barrel domain